MSGRDARRARSRKEREDAARKKRLVSFLEELQSLWMAKAKEKIWKAIGDFKMKPDHLSLGPGVPVITPGMLAALTKFHLAGQFQLGQPLFPLNMPLLPPQAFLQFGSPAALDAPKEPPLWQSTEVPLYLTHKFLPIDKIEEVPLVPSVGVMVAAVFGEPRAIVCPPLDELRASLDVHFGSSAAHLQSFTGS